MKRGYGGRLRCKRKSDGSAESPILNALCLVGIATFALGCETTIDNHKLEHLIKEKLKADKVDVKSLVCPANKRPIKGDKFECSGARASGEKLKIKAEIADEHG